MKMDLLTKYILILKQTQQSKNVQHGVEAFKKADADYIVAIGGGSSMDTSKAIGIIIANPEFEDVRSLEAPHPTKNPCSTDHRRSDYSPVLLQRLPSTTLSQTLKENVNSYALTRMICRSSQLLTRI